MNHRSGKKILTEIAENNKGNFLCNENYIQNQPKLLLSPHINGSFSIISPTSILEAIELETPFH